MSKYRVKSGIHMIGEKLVRAGDVFELESDTFIETSGRPDLFELAPPPAVLEPDDENEGGDENDEPRVVSTGREAAPATQENPAAPVKRGRKPKQPAKAETPPPKPQAVPVTE
ncbi:MAG: hypothetical protein BWY66_02918 [bacterium ADurb.Bin374]|nr:MAG: hypothetical protein BWY66_02918 [bacterium ADurb.Bin374]